FRPGNRAERASTRVLHADHRAVVIIFERRVGDAGNDTASAATRDFLRARISGTVCEGAQIRAGQDVPGLIVGRVDFRVGRTVVVRDLVLRHAVQLVVSELLGQVLLVVVDTLSEIPKNIVFVVEVR